ncbi:MAG TPA: 50S ribosomal protein L22 [Candidatus Woesearchaeota archaeon]|nr:50S ribosomal protein L22 [Candidatus Woesearchaeota archaeon]
MNYKLKIKEEESYAKARIDNVPVSLKQSVEIARFIRNKPLIRAYILLEGIVKKEIAVAFKRYGRAIGHKRTIAAGRFPQKAAGYFIKLLKNAEANASLKGLSKEDLEIRLICADKGTGRPKYGRKRGRTAKSTHLQAILVEREGAKREGKTRKQPRQKKTEQPKQPKQQKENLLKKEEKVPKQEAKEETKLEKPEPSEKSKAEEKPKQEPKAGMKKPKKKAAEKPEARAEEKPQPKPQEIKKEEKPGPKKETEKPEKEQAESKTNDDKQATRGEKK